MTPIVDIMFSVAFGVTMLKRLLPRIIPVTISATAVGTLEILKRAITNGMIRAATITMRSESCSIMFRFLHQKIRFLLYNSHAACKIVIFYSKL